MMIPTSVILAQSSTELLLELTVNQQLDCFEGHFPQNPVVPGAVLIGWCLHFAAAYFKSPQHAHSMRKIKFNKTIGPDQIISLHINYDQDQNQLQFFYINAEQQRCASGTLILQGTYA